MYYPMFPVVPVVSTYNPFPVLHPGVQWVPHPQPHPTISAQTFWQLSDQEPQPATVFDAAAAARFAALNGYPLPGTAPRGWVPPTFPPPGRNMPLVYATPYFDPTGHLLGTGPTYPVGLPTPTGSTGTGNRSRGGTPGQRVNMAVTLNSALIPNPGNDSVQWLLWDLRHDPVTARRVAPREVVLSATDRFGLAATHPEVPRVQIAYHLPAGLDMLQYWGAIDVSASGSAVSVRDVLEAVYAFFHTPLTTHEARAIQDGFPTVWKRVCDAFQRRCEEHLGIADVEWNKGVRRVDCLGDAYMWWGMWVTENRMGNTFQLNLGTVPRRGAAGPGRRGR